MRKTLLSLIVSLPAFILLSCGGGDLSVSATLSTPVSLQATNGFTNLQFTAPVFMTASPSGEDLLYVVEQAGRVLVFDNDPNENETDVFLDITDRVLAGGEQGLLGLAFDPSFETNRRFYVNYTADNPRRTVISRFTATNTTSTNANTEEVLLEVEQPFSNHNGGMIDFGADNMLFIAMGDGGSGGDPLNSGQDRSTLLGNILRIDVSGDAGFVVPSDNPFVGAGGGIREEIWAFGFRNPFRFSFDRQNGNLWLGDVGQSSREEVDLVIKGGNYGWRIFEGNLEFNNPQNLPASDFLAPVLDYDRDVGASVIGGYVYRGSKLPSLVGAYLYGDFISGRIFALVHDGQQVVSNTEVANVPNVSSFAEDRDGEVYAVSLNGQIFRLEEAEDTSSN